MKAQRKRRLFYFKSEEPMNKLVNLMITPIADRKWRPLPAALGLLGFLAAGPNALAAWYGQNTGEKMQPLASMAVRSNGPTVFTRDTESQELWEVWQYGGQWNSSLVYSQPDSVPFAASATYSQSKLGAMYDTYFVAHLDSDGQLRLSSWELANLFGGWTTQVVDSGTPTKGDTVAAVMFQGNLYLFYTVSNGINETLKVATYNGKTKTLDGDGVLTGAVVGDMHQPTAVSAPNGLGLYVYYFDSGHATLREAYTPDGINWTFNVIGNTFGYFPSAIVYQNNTDTTMNVFYTNMQNNLCVAFAQLGTSNWSSAVVGGIAGNNAPVINGGIQVYFVSPGGQVRVAYGTAANSLNVAAIDGEGGDDLTIIQTGTGVHDEMDATVTAVEVSGVGPSVFYRDIGAPNPRMRNSYWK
jgi:hypothetical protein